MPIDPKQPPQNPPSQTPRFANAEDIDNDPWKDTPHPASRPAPPDAPPDSRFDAPFPDDEYFGGPPPALPPGAPRGKQAPKPGTVGALRSGKGPGVVDVPQRPHPVPVQAGEEEPPQIRMSVMRDEDAPTATDLMLLAREGSAVESIVGSADTIMRVTPGGKQQLAENEMRALYGKEMIERAIATRPSFKAAMEMVKEMITPRMAWRMVYSWQQGGKDIEGGTIQLAMLLADLWGLSFKTSISSAVPQGDGTVEVYMEAIGVDLVRGKFACRAAFFRTSAPPAKFANDASQVSRWVGMQVQSQGSKLIRKVVQDLVPFALWWRALEYAKSMITKTEKKDGGFGAQLEKAVAVFAEKYGLTLEDLEGTLRTHQDEWHRGHLQHLRELLSALRENEIAVADLKRDGERWRQALTAQAEAALNRVKASPGYQAMGIATVKKPAIPAMPPISPDLEKQLAPESDCEGGYGGE